jgi:hypothetical protein
MKGYKNVSNNLSYSNTAKKPYHSLHNGTSNFHDSNQDIKNKRRELINKYNNSLSKSGKIK